MESSTCRCDIHMGTKAKQGNLPIYGSAVMTGLATGYYKLAVHRYVRESGNEQLRVVLVMQPPGFQYHQNLNPQRWQGMHRQCPVALPFFGMHGCPKMR